jgi:DNA-binding PadR family transcriptional regulator
LNADMKRDTLRRTILELLEKGSLHYTELDKKVCASCHPFATTNTFKSQFRYLLNNNCITRISRGIYIITEKGEKYLFLLVN